MSAIPAIRQRSPWGTPLAQEQHPHIEIVSSRSQRRARPRLISAVITVAALFAILAAQLLLSIASSEGAYEIAALQTKHFELSRDQQILTEQLQVLGAPQHLAAEARGMGMVAGTSAAHLRLADGVVLGQAVPAGGATPWRTSADGSPLIPDLLLAAVPLLGASTQAAASAAAATMGTGVPATGDTPAADTTTAAGTAPLPTAEPTAGLASGIPIPQTH